MKPINLPKIFMHTALPCEAKPLVEYFTLKKYLNIQPFAVYHAKNIYLIVTGVGKPAMAAGVAYTQALFPSESAIMLNVGIAGHARHSLGELFLIDKIVDSETLKNHYPPLICKPPCATSSLQTSSRPQLAYDHSHLCDMEASAFYETAIRFTSSELVCCLKIISDNALFPAVGMSAKQVSALITLHLTTVANYCETLTALAKNLSTPEYPLFDELLTDYHFTASEKLHLKTQLSRWGVLTDNQVLEINKSRLQTAKELLAYLEKQITQQLIVL